MTTKSDILARLATIRADVVTVENRVPPACGIGPEYLTDIITSLTDIDALITYVNANM